MTHEPERAKSRREKAAEIQAENKAISADEAKEVEERLRLRTPVIYEIVRQQGEEELDRPLSSLWWSGMAAGLSISFSVLAQAVLRIHLPAAEWRPLVDSLGYSVGFLIVVLAHQQLFTENTITVVLPVARKLTAGNLLRLARLWSVVFAANMVGTFVAALFCSFGPVLDDDIRQAMLEISRHMMEKGWWEMLFMGVSSGFLIATMVWLLPSAESSRFLVITMITWLIAAAGFTHIVAGSVEAFLLVLSGELGFGAMLANFTVPVLIGNIFGGTALFTMLSHAQVKDEI
ncbi:formate/nitrite transporter family protein [Propylenella binzhouense]|uniref:Formate/nitrite transporter family protein n=1 Tax=Propylenella binzhouense TaxID=2555902 RepID=A0A964T3P8_9HYPH|nr:formate/nitrite transporter family protein [Propylenella binzhouense]MYZ47635.1 formate/nitrite transporter family protein [Propylenella binzhouense]